MKVSKTEACRMLAESLEPFASLGDPETDERYELSPRGFWKTDLVKSERTGFMVRGWVHIDFFTDGNALWRLVEAMPEPTLKKDHYSEAWMCNASPSFSMVMHTDDKYAIVLAALRWRGLEVEIEG